MSTTDDLFDEDINRIASWLSREYRDEIGWLAQRFPKDQQALEVSWRDLRAAGWLHNVGLSLHHDSDELRDAMAEALPRCDLPVDLDQLRNAEVRIVDVPEEFRRTVDEAWMADQGEYVAIRGQVQKTTPVRHEPQELVYECQRCGTQTPVPQSGDEIQEPHQCAGCERNGPFKLDHDESVFRPHQLARLQQPPEDTKGGSAEHIDVTLRDDLVRSVQAGDRIDALGNYELRPVENSGTFEGYLDGEGVDHEETDYEEIDISAHKDEIEELADADDTMERLVASVAPKVQGHEDIKEAIVLQLFGGVRAKYPGGSTDRGDTHILLLGDPGTSKSTLLRAVESLSPRSVYASGKGASAAGMTAAAVADDFGSSKWTLEAGALVLANKGVACVDEIDKIDDSARSSMHEALEDQVVAVNKAGINATLPAQTSLLAAGNPKYGRFDPAEEIPEQIDLGPTLLSRFDLLFMLRDTPDEEADREIADSIVSGRQMANEYTHHGADADEQIQAPVEPEVFRSFVAYAKRNYHPRIADDDVQQALVESFTSLRTMNGEGDGTTVPVTFRKLEGIQRLAEASARIRLSETVEKEDVDRAQRLIGVSMQQLGMNDDGELDADIVEAGASMSQRDRIRTVKSLVREMQGDVGVDEPDLKDAAVDAGVSRDRIEKVIKKLKAKGEIWTQGDGYRVK